MKTALIVIDVQNDFCTGGALAVAGGDEVIAPTNRLIAYFQQRGAPIVYARDWHPVNHCSFLTQGGCWPLHCLQGSLGAAFHPDLHVPPDAIIMDKAWMQDCEDFSGKISSELFARLAHSDVRHVVLAGLATEYCIKSTALDARAAGFDVVVVLDAIRAVNLRPGDEQRALDEIPCVRGHPRVRCAPFLGRPAPAKMIRKGCWMR